MASLLTKLSIGPPSWIRGPVWTLIYSLMAVAATLAWQSDHSLLHSKGITLFMMPSVFNLASSWMLFHDHKIAVAPAEIILLRAEVAVTSPVFRKVTPTVVHVMLPYLNGLHSQGL